MKNRRDARACSFGDLSCGEIRLTTAFWTKVAAFEPLTARLLEWRLNGGVHVSAIGTLLTASHSKQKEPREEQAEWKQGKPKLGHAFFQ